MGKQQRTAAEHELHGSIVRGFQLATTEQRHEAARTGETADGWVGGWITWRIWPCRAAGGPRRRARRAGCSSSDSAWWLQTRGHIRVSPR